MFHIAFSQATAHEFGPILEQQYRFRYEIFVQTKGYEVPTHEGMEYDQFDTPAARYIVVQDEGRIVAMCRLIPTTMPYMLQSLWPEFVSRIPMPQDNSTWESTRFSVDKRLSREKQVKAGGVLTTAIFSTALQSGVAQIITVTPRLVFKKFVSGAGVAVTEIGERKRLGKIWAVAGIMEVNATNLHLLQEHHSC